MLITSYLFFDSIITKKLNSPSRTHDPISFPSKENKYYNSYKKIFINKIKRNKIGNIYVFQGIPTSQKEIDRYVTHYLSENCFNSEMIMPEIVKLSLKDCNDLR